MNTFGTLFRLTDFGESHGPAIGGVVDGMPAGIRVDFDRIRQMLARRSPGTSANVSARRENDEPEFMSGIFEGVTTGTPIVFRIVNRDARPEDYEAMRDKYRPNHADYTYDAKYGFRDHRGGGRASARETAVRVVAGALAMQVLEKFGVSIHAFPSAAGDEAIDSDADLQRVLEKARKAGDTIGGIVTCVVKGVPAGIGEPVFGKLQSMLAMAMMSINAAKGFEYGDGFRAAEMRGSECVDEFCCENGKVYCRSNHSGGIQGGISNGEDIIMRVAFKPIATLPRPVHTVDRNGNECVLEARGRHDVCVIPRAVPVVESMAALCILDAIMLHRSRLIP